MFIPGKKKYLGQTEKDFLSLRRGKSGMIAHFGEDLTLLSTCLRGRKEKKREGGKTLYLLLEKKGEEAILS